MLRIGMLLHVVFVATLAGCAASADASGLRLEAADQRLDLNPETGSGRFRFRVSNLSDERIILPRCGADVIVAIDRFDSAWERYSSGVCPGGLQASFSLEAGDVYDSGVVLREPGRYRLSLVTAGKSGDSIVVTSGPVSVTR